VHTVTHKPRAAPTIRIFSPNGRLIGTFGGVAQAKRALPGGVYIVDAEERMMRVFCR
jgi:hypothetical protein